MYFKEKSNLFCLYLPLLSWSFMAEHAPKVNQTQHGKFFFFSLK